MFLVLYSLSVFIVNIYLVLSDILSQCILGFHSLWRIWPKQVILIKLKQRLWNSLCIREYDDNALKCSLCCQLTSFRIRMKHQATEWSETSRGEFFKQQYVSVVILWDRWSCDISTSKYHRPWGRHSYKYNQLIWKRYALWTHVWEEKQFCLNEQTLGL